MRIPSPLNDLRIKLSFFAGPSSPAPCTSHNPNILLTPSFWAQPGLTADHRFSYGVQSCRCPWAQGNSESGPCGDQDPGASGRHTRVCAGCWCSHTRADLLLRVSVQACCNYGPGWPWLPQPIMFETHLLLASDSYVSAGDQGEKRRISGAFFLETFRD